MCSPTPFNTHACFISISPSTPHQPPPLAKNPPPLLNRWWCDSGGANIVPRCEIKSIIRCRGRSQGLAVRWRTASGMSPKSLLSKDFCIALCYTLITDVLLRSLQHHHFLFPTHSAHRTNTLTAVFRQWTIKIYQKTSIDTYLSAVNTLNTLLFLEPYVHINNKQAHTLRPVCI